MYHLTVNKHEHFFGNLDILCLISPRNVVSSNKLTLILNIVIQCDVKHIMMLLIKQ